MQGEWEVKPPGKEGPGSEISAILFLFSFISPLVFQEAGEWFLCSVTIPTLITVIGILAFFLIALVNYFLNDVVSLVILRNKCTEMLAVFPKVK